MKLTEALMAYLDYLKVQGRSERTLYTYGKDAAQISAFFGDKPLVELNRLIIGKFLKSSALLELPNSKKRAPHTVKKLGAFYVVF